MSNEYLTRAEARGAVARSENAYQQIRQRILEGTTPPDSVLREAELSRALGMSRTPVREALHRLRTEGYLRDAPTGGFLIVELDRDDLINVYQVRATLEGLAARLAAERASRTALARMEDLFDEMSQCVEADDDARLAVLNSEFHDVVAHASGNGYLQSMLRNIRAVFERFRPEALNWPGRRGSAHTEHRKLLEALRRGDGQAASQLAQEHVLHALDVRLLSDTNTSQSTEGDKL